MGWDDPGGNRDPWGRKAGPGSWDLDASVRRLWRRTRRLGHKTPSPWMVGGVLLAAIAVWFASGFYMVPQGSRAVLLLFGREIRVAGPGGHWHWPRPLGRARIVSVTRIHVVIVGYGADQDLGTDTASAPPEGTVLTGGQGLVHLEFAVQYRVRNPSEYLFSVAHPRRTISEVATAAMQEEAARRDLDALETGQQRAVERAVQAIVQRALVVYHCGVQVTGVRIQKVVPPRVVETAFSGVVRAEEDRSRLLGEAQAYANGILPKAKGEAAAEIASAQAYAEMAVARARGRARRFTALANAYARAPLVTRERLFIDGSGRVLDRARKVLVTTGHSVAIHVRMAPGSGPKAVAPPGHEP